MKDKKINLRKSDKSNQVPSFTRSRSRNVLSFTDTGDIKTASRKQQSQVKKSSSKDRISNSYKVASNLNISQSKKKVELLPNSKAKLDVKKEEKKQSNLFLNNNKKRLRSQFSARNQIDSTNISSRQKTSKNNEKNKTYLKPIKNFTNEDSENEEISEDNNNIKIIKKKVRLDSKDGKKIIKLETKHQKISKRVINKLSDDSEIVSNSQSKLKRGRSDKLKINQKNLLDSINKVSKKRTVNLNYKKEKPYNNDKSKIKVKQEISDESLENSESESSEEESEKNEEESSEEKEDVSEENEEDSSEEKIKRKNVLNKKFNQKNKIIKKQILQPKKDINKDKNAKKTPSKKSKSYSKRPIKPQKAALSNEKDKRSSINKGNSKRTDDSKEKKEIGLNNIKKVKKQKESSKIKKSEIKIESEEIEEEEKSHGKSKQKKSKINKNSQKVFGVKHDQKFLEEDEMDISLNESMSKDKFEHESHTDTLIEKEYDSQEEKEMKCAKKETKTIKEKKVKGPKHKKEKVTKPKKEKVTKPKKEKTPKPKKEKAPKQKKEKIYTKFTKGKFNPAVMVIDTSECFDSTDSNIIDECCVSCNNRNVIRAANTNNLNLFQECIQATNKISSIFEYWSSDSKTNIFEILIKNKNKEFLTEIIKYLESPKQEIRVSKPEKHSWNIDTGCVSYQTFGTYTRKLNMSRGNRMGINAFTDDKKSYFDVVKTFKKSLFLYCDDFKFIQYIEALLTALKNKYQKENQDNNYNFNFNSFSNSYNKKSNKKLSNELTFTEYIHNFALHGNRKILSLLIKRVSKLSYYGYNSLHSDVLNFQDGNFQISHRASLNKKSNEYKLTPVHLAALNPCGDVLKNIVSLGGDLYFPDSKGNKPIHFAAICEGKGPLEYLASINYNFEELNQKKNTALLLACKFGRLENVKVICQNPNFKLYHKNKFGMNAICFAAKHGHNDVIEYLVKEKGFKIDTPGTDRKTALMFAAGRGHIETVKKLLELGAKVTKKDKFKRTPLIFSVKSGQAVITSLLLKKGAEFNAPDSSNNFPLHYACAFGWKENIKLLLEAGADINSICDWNITPLELCILQRHTGLVFYLLENSNIDVNAILYGGNTLLHRYMENLSPEIFEDIKYLIEKKKANVNIVNNEGKAPIHYLAQYTYENFSAYYMTNKNLILNSSDNLQNSVYSFYAFDTNNKIANGEYEHKHGEENFNVIKFYNLYSNAIGTGSLLYNNSAYLWAKYYEFINKIFELLLNNNCKIDLDKENSQKKIEDNIEDENPKSDGIVTEKMEEAKVELIKEIADVNMNVDDRNKMVDEFFNVEDSHKTLEENKNNILDTDQNDKNIIIEVNDNLNMIDVHNATPVPDIVNYNFNEKNSENKITNIKLNKNDEVEFNKNSEKKKPQNPFFLAIKSHNYPLIEKLMKLNYEIVEFTDENNSTIFHLLSSMLFDNYKKNEPLMKFILEKCRESDCSKLINRVNKQGYTPIIQLFLNYYNLLDTKLNQIQNEEINKLKLQKFKELNISDKLKLFNHICEVCKSSKKKKNEEAKINVEEAKVDDYTNNLEDNDIEENATENLINPISIFDNNFNTGGKGLFNNNISRSRFPKKKKKFGRRHGHDQDDEENVIIETAAGDKNNEIDEEKKAEEEMNKIINSINLDLPEKKINRNEIDIKHYQDILKEKLDLDILTKFSFENFFKSRDIYNKLKSDEMDVEYDKINNEISVEQFEKIINDEKDYFDDYINLGFILNNITLTECDRREICKKASEEKLEEFANLEFLKMLREFISFGGDYNIKIKKIEKIGPNKTVINSFETPLFEIKKSEEESEIDDKNDCYTDSSKKRWNILMLISKYPLMCILKILIEEFKIDINYCDPEKLNFAMLCANNISNIKNYNKNSFINLFKYLLSNGLNINHKNKNGENIFYLLGSDLYNNIQDLKFLAENNIDINNLNSAGSNLLFDQLNKSYHGNYDKAKILKLIENFNFDINKQDLKLNTFLHYLILKLRINYDVDISLLQKILSLGADCNIKNIYERTPLHYLFLDENSETQNNSYIDPIVYLSTLLEIKDINTNIPDYLGNIPLHYAAQRGSTICAMSLFNKDFINFKNKEGNTPLSYALIFDQVNIATYLFQQNSNIDENVFPLKERNIEKYLKEKELEAKKLSLLEFKNKSKTEDKKNEYQTDDDNLMNIDDKVNEAANDIIEVDEEYNKNEEDSKKCEEDQNNSSDEENISEEESDYDNDSDADSGFPVKERAYFSGNVKRAKPAMGFGFNNQSYNNCNLNNEYRNQIFRKNNGEYEESISIFRFTVKKNYQGLMYLFVNSGFDLMIAIQECIVEKMINLALLLLDKSPYNECYKKLNSKKQNLFHVLAINYSSDLYNNGKNDLNQIFEKLCSKGIDLYEQDHKGYTPLHYSCENNLYNLVQLIITQIDLKKNNKILTKDGLTPFLCFMKKLMFSDYEKYKSFEYIDLYDDMNLQFTEEKYGNYRCTFLIYLIRNFNMVEEYYEISYLKSKNDLEKNSAKKNFAKFAPRKTIKTALNQKAGRNQLQVNNQTFINIFNNNNYSNTTNFFYDSNTNNPFGNSFFNQNNNINLFGNQEEKTKEKIMIEEEDNPKTSIFNKTEFAKFFEKLISFGANIMQKDSEGLDTLFYCVKENNYELIKYLVNNFKGQITFDQVDNENKSLLHHVICPVKGAFFENEKILKFLISNGFKYNLTDKNGKTPIDYAFEKNSDYYINIFKALNIITEDDIDERKAFKQESEKIKKENLVLINKENYLNYYHEIDYEKDAETLLNENLSKNQNVKQNLILPDSVGNFDIKNNLVVKEFNSNTNSDDYYDVTLTNVNVMNGIYGQYLFYRMQLIHDVDRNVYVLWNRWGMIEETGAYQRTPFISLAEAKTEFKKIFKSKTGNEWENKHNFEKVYGKYMLLKFKNSKVEYNKLLKPYEFKKLPKSEIKEKAIFELIKEFTNSSLYFKALKTINIDESSFNIEFLDKNLLLKAEDILDKIKETQEELKSFANTLNYDDSTIEKIQKLNVKIYEYSNSYYELIPRERFKNKPVKPLINLNDLSTERGVIENLSYFENIIKILLGSIYKKNLINPIDYVLSSMNLKISSLKKEESQYNLIMNYIKNSKHTAKIKNIFHIEKIGEAEVVNSKWNNFKNKTLLFHGSKVFNFLGILTNGLKICPNEAPCNGTAFGRGIYFSDHFSKSYAYCDYFEYENTKHEKIRNKYMLICEVALGNMFDYDLDKYDSKIKDLSFLKEGYDSLFVKGNIIANPNKILTMDNGIKIPSGSYINNQYSFGYGFSEFIVFDPSQVRIRYIIQTE